MNSVKKNLVSFCLVLLAVVIANPCFAAGDAGYKFGVVSIQTVIDQSQAGKSARKVLQAKQSELQPKLMEEKTALEKEAKDIEKKSSAWSAEKKQDTEREYKKKMRAYQLKVDDAQYTMKQLQKSVLDPIFKQLQGVINEVGQEEGMSMIFEKSRSNGLLYASKSLDITDIVLKKLDSKKAAK